MVRLIELLASRAGCRPVRARVIAIVYLTAAAIATIGWIWLLFYCLALPFGPSMREQHVDRLSVELGAAAGASILSSARGPQAASGTRILTRGRLELSMVDVDRGT